MYKSNVSSTQMWMWWFMTIQHWYFPPLTTQSEQSVSLTLHLRWGCVCRQCLVWVVVVEGAACPLGVMMQSNAAGEDSQQLYHTLSVQLDKNTGHVKIKWSTSLMTNTKLSSSHVCYSLWSCSTLSTNLSLLDYSPVSKSVNESVSPTYC